MRHDNPPTACPLRRYATKTPAIPNGMTGAQTNVSEPTRKGETRCEKRFERGAAVDAEVHGFVDFLTAIGAMRGDRSKEVGDLASATRTELVGGLEGRAALGAGAYLCGSGGGSRNGTGLDSGLGRILDNRLACRLRLLLSHSLFGSSSFSCSSGLRLSAGGLLGYASLLGLILSASRLNGRILLINSRINSIYLGKLIGKTGGEFGFACHGVKCLAQLGIGRTKRFAQTHNLVLRCLYLCVQLFFGHYDTCQSNTGQRHSHHRVGAIVYRAARACRPGLRRSAK